MRSSMPRIYLGILVCAGLATSARGQGIIVPSAGPINSAMAGASTAAPVDFGGSYWNPAILSGLDEQEFLLGSALAFPSIHLQSSLAAGSVGGVFPPTNRFGEARSDSGVAAGLATGFSFRMTDDSPLTLGLGIFGLVGGGVNFPGAYQAPILTPRQPPNYFGVGPIYANLSLLGDQPDGLVAGHRPTGHRRRSDHHRGHAELQSGLLRAGPEGRPRVADVSRRRPTRDPTGAPGSRSGLLYELNDNWNLGFSYKSPVWQERWDFNAATPTLAPRRIGIQASLPGDLLLGRRLQGAARRP